MAAFDPSVADYRATSPRCAQGGEYSPPPDSSLAKPGRCPEGAEGSGATASVWPMILPAA
jgi:hypothetical protein